MVPVEKLDGLITRALAKAGLRPLATNSKPGLPSGGVTNNYDITINNPRPEPASESTRRVLLRQSYGLLYGGSDQP